MTKIASSPLRSTRQLAFTDADGTNLFSLQIYGSPGADQVTALFLEDGATISGGNTEGTLSIDGSHLHLTGDFDKNGSPFGNATATLSFNGGSVEAEVSWTPTGGSQSEWTGSMSPSWGTA